MCGIAGVYGREDAGILTSFMLHALQHRGQESAGIVSGDGNKLRRIADMGLVSSVFNDDNIKKLKGDVAVGHVRYSTQGSSSAENAHPMVFRHKGEDYVFSHNGNIMNVDELTWEMEDRGSIFNTEVDTERIAHRFMRTKGDNLERLIEAVNPDEVKGSYSMLIMNKNELYVVRDPQGFRPLWLGKFSDGSYAVASEDVAFGNVGAEPVREVEPGEILKISKNGLESSMPWGESVAHPCIFELIYFANPNSNIFGMSVLEARKSQGRTLAREMNLDADLVSPIPDSGTYGAIGFSEESGIPFDMAFVRNHYVGRTFIMPTQELREKGVNMKLIPARSVIQGKDIIFIEDSIVRGTTVKNKVRDLIYAGAKSASGGVCSRPIIGGCYYGTDFPDRTKLIANQYSIEEIEKNIRAKKLAYISEKGMLDSAGYEAGKREFCYACMGGKYPVGENKNFCNGKC